MDLPPGLPLEVSPPSDEELGRGAGRSVFMRRAAFDAHGQLAPRVPRCAQKTRQGEGVGQLVRVDVGNSAAGLKGPPPCCHASGPRCPAQRLFSAARGGTGEISTMCRVCAPASAASPGLEARPLRGVRFPAPPLDHMPLRLLRQPSRRRQTASEPSPRWPGRKNLRVPPRFRMVFLCSTRNPGDYRGRGHKPVEGDAASALFLDRGQDFPPSRLRQRFRPLGPIPARTSL
jgi:hypothetical protein